MRQARFDRVVVAEVKINRMARPHEVEVKAAFVDSRPAVGGLCGWAIPERALSPAAQQLFDAFVQQVESDLEGRYFGEPAVAREGGGMRPPPDAGPDDDEIFGIGEGFGEGVRDG